MQHFTGMTQVVGLATADTTGDRLPILPLWGELVFGVCEVPQRPVQGRGLGELALLGCAALVVARRRRNR